tara:strand:- start:586 stop:1848 length:1263 start_codon:yes stop_codon:yes gene_type:complete
MYFEKKNIKALTYLIVFVVLIIVIFFSYKTYNNYRDSSTLYNYYKDNVNETLLIKDWTSGNNAPIKPTTIMPQSVIPSEYSISFLIYLNDLQQTDTNKEQIVFIKGTPNDSELTLSIKPLRYNPHSDLRFTCKLQVDVEKTDINKLLNEVNNDNLNTETTIPEKFTNTQNNSSRIHNKIGSNIIDYFTVQNIYDSSIFNSISKDTFKDTPTTNDNSIIEKLKKDITTKKQEIDKYGVDTSNLIPKIDNFIKTHSVNIHKQTVTNLNEQITILIDDSIIPETIVKEELEGTLKLLSDTLIKITEHYEQLKNIEETLYGSTKDEDFVELPSTSTQKVLHICIVIRDNIMDIYKNGMLESSKVLDSFPLMNSGKFTFFPDQNKSFNGLLNKFTYFNKALTHNEVGNNYKKYLIEINRNTKFDK